MLAGMGPLPGEGTASQTEIERRTHLLDEVALVPPTRDEIAALIAVFPADDGECFGLSWTLLHVIESGPHWPDWDALNSHSGPWVDLLRLRLRNAGIARPSP